MDITPKDRVRRLATIVAADIFDYSRLMNTDEEGTYAALRTARSDVIDPKIEEHQGRIVKHMGDGFLAEFPIVLAAVQFAMAMQEAMRTFVKDVPEDKRIRFRIGINLGDIIVDDDGDIFGDGVNVAARLEKLGIPGGICISNSVYDSVHKKLDVDFDDLGDQSVKNIPTPVHAYDVRWEGEGGTPTDRAVKPRSKRRRVALTVGAVALALAVGFVALNTLDLGSDPAAEVTAPEVEKSIAVLPFVNMSDDASNEYFSDGLSEELLNLLATIPELRVAARTSSFSYKGKNVRIAQIGEELNVAYVLEGSVRKAGNQVRITAQLIQSKDEFQLWSTTFDRTLDDIFAIQDEIASEVMAQLKITLLGDAPTVKKTDPNAYALYLQARHLRRQETPEALEQSIALFQQALEIDPDYAAAWNGLVRSYIRQANAGLRPIDESYRLAREAANRALAIDQAFAPAHASLGLIAMFHDSDLSAAARHYERSLELEPTNTGTLLGAALLAYSLGRLDDAIAFSEYVVHHDPVNEVGHRYLTLYNLWTGRLDEAIASARTALSLNPGRIGTQGLIGFALLFKGELEAALAATQQESFEAWRLIGLVMVHHALGQASESDAALAALIDEYEQAWAYNVAYVLAFRGEADRAFEWLKKAVQYKDPGLMEISNHHFFANIYDDPRWLPFLESIGKSPEQLAAIEFKVTLPE